MAGSCMTLTCVAAVVAMVMSVGPSEIGEATRTGYACEDSTLTIDCGEQADKQIYVVRANYGRQNIAICNAGDDTSGWNLQCISTRAAGRVAEMCNGRVKCEIHATNRLFGDSCYLTPKYLEVQFKCQVPPPPKMEIMKNARPQYSSHLHFPEDFDLKFEMCSEYPLKSKNQDDLDMKNNFLKRRKLLSDKSETYKSSSDDTDIPHWATGSDDEHNNQIDNDDDTYDKKENSGDIPTEKNPNEEIDSDETRRSRNVDNPGYFSTYANGMSTKVTIETHQSESIPSVFDWSRTKPTETSPRPPPTTTTSATTTTTPAPTPHPKTTEVTTTASTTTTPTPTPKVTTKKPTPRPTAKPTPRPTPKPTPRPTPKPPPTTKFAPPPMKHTTTTERMIGDQGRPITHCEQQVVRGVIWPRTPKGAWAIRECPNNPSERRAAWQCGSEYHAAWLGKPDLSNCKSLQLEALGEKLALAREDFSSDIVTEVASELQQTSVNPDLFGGDLKAMSMIMEDMVQQVDTQTKNESKPISKRFVHNINEAVLNTSSNILASEKEETWTDLPQSVQAETATRVISTVEESAYQMADTYREPTVVVNLTLNIMLQVNVIDMRSEDTEDISFPQLTLGTKPSRSDWMSGGNSIRLSKKSLKDLSTDGLARVVFLSYNNLEKWLRPQPDPRYLPDSRPDSHQEFRAREQEFFDPNEIEFESNPDIHRELSENALDPDAHSSNSNPNQRPKIPTEAERTAPTTARVEETTPAAQENKTTKIVNSQIISASVMHKTKDSKTGDSDTKGHVQLSEPILYTLEHKTTNNVYNPTCSFWEYSERTFNGRWSNFGCRVKDTNVTHTTCSCSHVTNFAILMDVQAQELSDEHEFALAFITYLGCILSAVCLLLAFLTFAVFKNLQCDRNTIHKNLVLCLLIAEVLFLCGIMQHSKPILCSVIAAFLHYFFLAAFMWMLMEGVQLYVMLVEVFESEKSRVKYYYLMAYGTPAIVVGVSAAVDHTGYGTDSHCWLSAEGGFIWAFVGPVIGIITINIVMLSIAIYQMCKHADAAAGWKMKQKSKMENVRSWVKGASVLVVLLGLTWTFGLLYINQHTIFMAYIFTILNTLQGLFIFIFHCAMNEKIQKEYKRCIRHATWLPESIRVKYGDAKPYASTSPNQSSSSGNKSQKTTKTTPEIRISLEYLTRLISGRRRKRSTSTVRSSLSNPSRGQYPNNKADKISPLESGHMTDSGIGRHPDSICNDTSEDQGGYLEPVSIRVNDHLLDDMEAGAEFSMMEGSCVDTDCYGIEAYKKPPTLDIDKYKIKSPGGRLSAISDDRPMSESDFSDGELVKMCEKEKMMNEYEELLPCDSEPEKEPPREGYDTMLQRKLKQFENDNAEDIPPACMNNLNKGDNEAYRDSLLLSEPNIMGREDTLKRHLPTYKDNNVCGDSPDKVKKITPHSAKYVVNPAHDKTTPSNRC